MPPRVDWAAPRHPDQDGFRFAASNSENNVVGPLTHPRRTERDVLVGGGLIP